MQFLCRQCGLPVTLKLEPLPSPDLLDERDGEDYVPRGFYHLGAATQEDVGFFTNEVGCILINLKDAQNTKRHHESRRLQGCCGPSGLDGRNIVCLNGHEVGTETSDCYLPHVLMLDLECVTPKE